ncbi:pectin acetylesterase 5 isoform X2 [Setaria viridis]|nr:pectin acetylesterase 5-like isoform X2 [Setaria viridis]
MATEHNSQLVVRKHRPAGHTHTVAVAVAPLFVLLAAAFSGSPVAVAADSSPGLVELTLVAGAQEKGAGILSLCLDGSPPAYHLQRGSGSGSQSWIVFLQGGAWCSSNTTETCSGRKMTAYGSSKFMEPITFDGVFNDQQPQNPDFYNWNKVFVRYCDGASFSGNAEGEAEDGTKLYFRGLRIWEAVIAELMGKGMDTAKQALLAGCSAGGLATLLHCDNFRAKFPQEVSVKCVPDGGFFLDAKDLSGERSMRSVFNGVVQLQNVSEVLPKDCLAKKDPTDCFFPAELIKSISTPTFIVNSEYDSWQIQNVVAPVGSYPGDTWSNCRDNIGNCSSKQIDVLHGFRRKLIHELKAAEGKREWGLFIDSCFTHCQTQWNGSWHSPTSPRLDNKTIAEAVGDWYFGRRKGVKQIDCKYPCNPTCGS